MVANGDEYADKRREKEESLIVVSANETVSCRFIETLRLTTIARWKVYTSRSTHSSSHKYRTTPPTHQLM